FVLGATNLPEDIDPAILSRFTSKIEIPLPDEAARREMLKRLIAERAVDPALDVEEISAVLAKRLSRKSGRDLVMLVNRAMERRANRIKCAANLRQIGLAISRYANSHRGRLPDSLAELPAAEDLALEVFTCPSSNTEPAQSATSLPEALFED